MIEEIQIKGKTYFVSFGLSQVIRMGRKLGYKTLNEVGEALQKIADGDLEAVENVAIFIKDGLDKGCEKKGLSNDLDVDDIIDLMIANPDTFGKLTELFTTSLIPEGVDIKDLEQAAAKKNNPKSLGGGLKKPPSE